MRRVAYNVLLMVLLAMQTAVATGQSATTGERGSPAAPAPERSRLLDWLGVESWADIPQPGTWGGALDIGMDGNQQQTRSPNSAAFKTSGRLMTEGFTLRNQGFSLVNPSLLTGSTTLRFALQQIHQEAGGIRTAQNGQLTGYNLDATVLGEQPYNATVLANRSQNRFTQLSGGSTLTENQNRALVLRWREDSFLREREILPYFSATAQLRQDHTNELTTLADRTFRRDEQRGVAELKGHNGSPTSDLDFHLERTSLDNLLFPRGSYQGKTARLSYSQDWGPNLNRRWDSRLDYSTRSGDFSMSLFNLDQRMSIEHYANLSTDYHYHVMQQVTEIGTTSLQSGGMNLQHRLYDNLSSSLGASAARQILPNGSIDTKTGQAGFGYHHAIPWSGQLHAALGGGLQVTNNQLQSSQISVLNASYLAPPAFGAGANFLLNESFVVPGSIVVVDVRGGARLPTTVGIDYQIVVEGNRTRILPQPTSLVILPGDPLEVSYTFAVDPSLKFQTASRSFSLGADWRWIGVSVSHDESRQTALSGDDSRFLTNRRTDTARAELRSDWDNRLQARGDAVWSRYKFTQLVYDELRSSQQLTYSPREELRLGLSASQTRAEFQFPRQRESRGRTVRLDVDWASPSGWLTNAYLSRRVLRDTQLPADAVTEAAIKFQRRWTKLAVSGTFSLAQRSRGDVQTNSGNFHLSAIREF